MFLKRNVVIKDISYFSLLVTEGIAVNDNYHYQLYFENEKIIASYKPYGKNETITVEVEKEILSRLEDILNRDQVRKWKGYYKNNRSVLDGGSFSFQIRYLENKEIYAHGYMKYPKNYKEVVHEIRELYREVFPEDELFES